MFRFVPLCLLLGSYLLADAPAELEGQIRTLSAEIEKARGLKFKQPVKVRVAKREKGERPGVNAYYDIRKKEVVLYDDIKGNYGKGVLIHELVHALQDQHFDLKKLHEATFGSDAELARAALIEGDAMLVTIEMLQKEQPGIGKMLDSSLAKAKNLQNAFLYGQGARWVKHTKDRGKGWEAVNRRYAFPPMSTASILHPGEFIQPVKLGPGKTVGEYGIIKMLMDNERTAPKAVEAASGWRGDRLIEEGENTGWAVAFADEKQAERFHDALKLHPGKAKSAISREGKRVYEVSAASERAQESLLERLKGRPLLTVYSTRDKKVIGFGQMIDGLAEADIVCVGEQHDSFMDHHVQLMIIKALFALDERTGVGMEMFQRPFQKALDRYVSGAIGEEAFLEDSEYQKRWGFDWALYRPIVEFCRANRLPLAALNIGNELRARLSKEGHEKLTEEEKKQLGEVDFHVKPHREFHFPRLGQMHGPGTMSKDQQERMYQIMAAWDDYMAGSAVRFLTERKLRRMVVLAGSGHIDRWFGIPDRAARRLKGGTVRTVRIVSGGTVEGVAKEPHADYVILLR
jgi:uncharacterized iron-regulated protein